MFDRRRSLAVGKGRVIEISARIRVHPCDLDDLSDIVPCYKTRSRIMSKMMRRRQAYVQSIQVWDGTGVPRKTFCRYRVNTPSHHNALTKVFRALDWPACERGPALAPVHDTVPDALTPYPRMRYWEMDMGTEGFDEIEKKVKAYRQQDHAVLFVCLTEARRQKLIDWTESIRHLTFLALWDELREWPAGRVWMSASGAACALSFMGTEERR